MVEADGEEGAGDGALSQERYAEMSAAEQFVLTISENGYGKRTPLEDFRKTRRGGKGVYAIGDGGVYKIASNDAPRTGFTADQLWTKAP